MLSNSLQPRILQNSSDPFPKLAVAALVIGLFIESVKAGVEQIVAPRDAQNAVATPLEIAHRGSIVSNGASSPVASMLD